MAGDFNLPPDFDPSYFMEPTAATREAFERTVNQVPPPQLTTCSCFAEVSLDIDEYNALNAMIHYDRGYTEGQLIGRSNNFYITVVKDGQLYKSSSTQEDLRAAGDADSDSVRGDVCSLLELLLAGRADAIAGWMRGVNQAIDRTRAERAAAAEALADVCPGRTDRSQTRSGIYYFWNESRIETTLELPYDAAGDIAPLDSAYLTLIYRDKQGKCYTYTRSAGEGAESMLVSDDTLTVPFAAASGEEGWQTLMRAITDHIGRHADALSRGVDSLTDGKMRDMTAGMQAALRAGIMAIE